MFLIVLNLWTELINKHTLTGKPFTLLFHLGLLVSLFMVVFISVLSCQCSPPIFVNLWKMLYKILQSTVWSVRNLNSLHIYLLGCTLQSRVLFLLIKVGANFMNRSLAGSGE